MTEIIRNFILIMSRIQQNEVGIFAVKTRFHARAIIS